MLFIASILPPLARKISPLKTLIGKVLKKKGIKKENFFGIVINRKLDFDIADSDRAYGAITGHNKRRIIRKLIVPNVILYLIYGVDINVNVENPLILAGFNAFPNFVCVIE